MQNRWQTEEVRTVSYRQEDKTNNNKNKRKIINIPFKYLCILYVNVSMVEELRFFFFI